MKRNFTFLIAAVALLASLTIPLGMWGQTRTTQTAFYGFESGDAGWTATTFVTNNTAITAHGGSKYGATNGSTATLKYNDIVASPQSLTCYVSKTTNNTTTSTWYIQVSTDGTTWTNVSDHSATSMTKGEWVEFTANLSSYSNVYVQIKYDGTSAVRALDDITLTYDDGNTPSTDPDISFTPASIALGEVLVGNQASATFSVSQAYLESGITLTVDNGNLSPSSIAQGAAATTVTWSYTPATAGTISATVTATSGETSETLAISGTAIAPVEGYDVDFEYATGMYPNWTFDNMTTYQTGSITAHGGTYYGTTGGKATASITTTSTVANPGTLTCYVSKQSGNTSSSTWYIQVSENGSTWTEVESHSATSMSQGSWVEFTADLTDYTNVYVRVYYSGSTAIRNIDDLTLTTVTPSPAVATTTTINVPQDFNNDIHTATNNVAGTLTATVKDNENNTISGATVIWSSSNTDVATIAGDGVVTLVAVGTTTITARYAGVEDEYQASSATYELTVTSSAPYVQPNPVEINMNYVWLGSSNGSNLNANQLPVVKVDDNVTTTITDGTSNHPRGDSDYIRIYIGSTLTFDAPDGYVITGIEFTTGGNNTWNAPTASTGTLSDKTWTGDATSVVFTMTGSCFISKATITLGEPSTDPYITVESDSFELTANEEEGYLEITYGNFIPTSLDIMFCDANGDALSEDPDWIMLAIEAPAGETGDFVYYYAGPNNGAARTAYFMVFDDDVYSNIVTVTQNAPVVDYAFLPFEWDTFGTTPTGITNSGVSTGSSNAYLKFDSSGDYIVLQINEAPGALSFDVKGNPGNNNVWAGTFKVQTSVDGTTYSDLATYDNLPTNDYQSESFTTLNAAVRYIKWVYTEKEQGNVALDNIKLDKVYTKDIVGNTWYFIASPTGSAPSNVDALSDLYYYDEQNHYWRNKKVTANAASLFNFDYGKGYLCANGDNEDIPATVTLSFTGDLLSSNTRAVDVYYHTTTQEGQPNGTNGALAGWNLVGNPFNSNATLDVDCFILNGSSINTTAQTAGYVIAPFAGVMVKASATGSVLFTKVTENAPAPQPNQVQIVVEQKVLSRGVASTSVHDNAIINFNEGSQLEKFSFNPDAAKLYIPQNGKEYAIYSAQAQGEMPVNFKASTDGEYTITVSTEGVEMNYLHLIDNMTGMDVDLLQTPNYTFDATTSDYESRFRLVFAGASTSSATDETFAYYDGSEWQVSNEGEATLQVVDVMGRIVSTETVNGTVATSINATPGVYMLRLVNGNEVKTQKIVVR